MHLGIYKLLINLLKILKLIFDCKNLLGITGLFILFLTLTNGKSFRPSPHNIYSDLLKIPSLNSHLTFYGITVDENEKPLPDVLVKGGVMVWDGNSVRTSISLNTLSGPDGRFQFDADNGQRILVSVSKSNYVSPPPQSFQYGRVSLDPIHQPDINSPVVFALTKQDKLDNVYEVRRGLVAKNTGEPVHIDLSTGAVVPEGGDLIVSIYCPEPYKNSEHIPWKLSLSAPGGGLVEVHTESLGYMNKAPADGYGPIVVVHERDDPKWNSQYDGFLYLKSRGGALYAKMRFDMHVRWDERGVPFGFEAYVNTNGSRNLLISK